jgi:hypothetical protein
MRRPPKPSPAGSAGRDRRPGLTSLITILRDRETAAKAGKAGP